MNIIETMIKENTMDNIKNISENFHPQGTCILWQPAEEGLRIIRVYSSQACLSLPKTLGGRLVTEIGAYCFSASLPRYTGPLYYSQNMNPDLEKAWTSGSFSSDLSQLENRLFPFCGNAIEDLRLPTGVQILHNGAFYNCRKLARLSVGPDIRGIGSDCFTNNRLFHQLIMRADPHSSRGLKLLLERLAQDLTVCFTDQEGTDLGSLYFPEYYEWLDEITAAHIFSRSIRGAGFRMRKCFQDNRLDFEKYDQCFEAAVREESPETLCRICLARLTRPIDLKTGARKIYEQALEKRLGPALSLAIEERDSDTLSWLCRTFSPDRKLLADSRSLCLDKDWSQGAALLMEMSAPADIKKRFSFD